MAVVVGVAVAVTCVVLAAVVGGEVMFTVAKGVGTVV